jgi:SPOR domain
MGHIARILAALAILAAGSLPLAAFDGPTQTTGSKKKAGATSKPADEPAEKEGGENDKQKVAVLAQRALEAGIKLYESGKTDEAVKTLDVALHGGLSSQQVARAFYYRGLANRKLGKPGLAISDLTSAVWLKDGLVGPEREAALKNRVAAYQDAGISNVPDLPNPTFAADPPSTSGWQTAMNGSPVTPTPAVAPAAPSAPVKPAAASHVPGYLSSFAGNDQSTDQSTPGPPASTSSSSTAHAPGSALAATSTTNGPPSAQTSSGGIGGFFSSIFGGGSSNTPNANDGTVSTSSIAPPPPQPAAAAAQQSTGWSQTTQVATAASGPDIGSAFVTQVSTSEKASQAEKTVASREPSGKFRLQVAAVRSRSEADALAAKLVASHGGELGSRRPEISEAALGNMGTFYRVRVGPYADAKEPQQLCGGLRSSGFDCLVVTQ